MSKSQWDGVGRDGQMENIKDRGENEDVVGTEIIAWEFVESRRES